MISWMQKNRKYLVVTIWISTIAFVGAGFVGWGTYQYGNKSNSVAKVGDIPITLSEYQNSYSNLFQQYNQAMGGILDEATAKKLGLHDEALKSLIYRALIKNFALEHDIRVSDKEVKEAIVSIPAFQKDGKFDKETYLAILSSMRIKPKEFEANIKDDLLVKKSLELLDADAVPLEIESFGSAIFLSDKIKYDVIRKESIKVDIDERMIKEFWEKNRQKYMTPARYKLSLVKIEPSNKVPSDDEIEEHYKENRLEFTDEEGKVLPLKDVREKVIETLKLKAVKRSAQLAYIDLKKEKISPQETIIVDENDPRFSDETWKSIKEASQSDILKPKIENGKYLVIKIEETILPRVKTFEEAYKQVKADFVEYKKKEKLLQVAKARSEMLTNAYVSDFLTRDSVDKLKPLTEYEASEFLNMLFSSKEKNGAVLLDNLAVSYEILEQKLLNEDKLNENRSFIEENAKKMKSALLQESLLEKLKQQYSVEIYIKEN